MRSLASVPLLKDKEPDVRLNTVNTLAKIGPDAREAVPALIPLLKDKSRDVREATEAALEKIQKK